MRNLDLESHDVYNFSGNQETIQRQICKAMVSYLDIGGSTVQGWPLGECSWWLDKGSPHTHCDRPTTNEYMQLTTSILNIEAYSVSELRGQAPVLTLLSVSLIKKKT